MIFEILIKSGIAVLSASAGAGMLFFINLSHKKLCVMISLSAGALLGAAVFSLIPLSFRNIGVVEVFLSAASGYLLFWLLSKYYSHVCPACAASHFDEQTTKKFSEIILTLLTVLSIHSFLDGLAISGGNVSAGMHGESIFTAITVHKFPEGLALAALMLSSNYSKSKIILYVISVELTTIIGALTGIFFLQSSISSVIIGILMAHVAGGFIYLAFHAVMGEMFRHHKNLVVLNFLAGLLLILIVHLLFN